ncbi:DUF262 domain-containing protein [Candidatus Accumulibacter sp. ACC012]|uniref:DUF262 domain-containing protein n=1 Tax=Candidatus Accumulibacter sp. ACC012 TaxID=2823332 RepID=UPI0025C6E789|nr:DUF262 domain-containing protein [Candidatus Accumulibacter sp. ACC012]
MTSATYLSSYFRLMTSVRDSPTAFDRAVTSFFDELVGYRPAVPPDDVLDVAQQVSDQRWFFRSWRLDPTIQSVLCMLKAIHERFASSSGLFSRLIDENQPAITFQLLDLKNFGLSDDLYIKMNARGKPLTAFETFKARYEQELEEQFEDVTFSIGEQNFPVAKYVALRMDTAWADLFWRLRDQKSNLYDGALMNMFRAVALVTRSPDDEEYSDDILLLRNGMKAPSYTDFHLREWLDERFTMAIIHLFDAWSAESGKLTALLPDQRYFDERSVFDKIVSNGASLSYVELVQFAAYVGFVAKHQDALNYRAFQEWMRIAHNLSANTEYNRPDDLRRSILGLNNLLQHSEEILNHFAETDNPASGFSPHQIAEEKLKAELILAHDTWRESIDRAEGHGYFRGQVEFLLDFSGAITARNQTTPGRWEAEFHADLQERFLRYLSLAENMFTASGLRPASEFLWQRALLSVGDYLLPSRRNRSFLVGSTADQASWKRLLRGTGEKAPEARKALHQLWDKLAATKALEPQLARVVEEGTNLEPWRAALVRTPSAIEYCENQSIRWNSETEIYLLSKTQMNGAHAELFTFCLYKNQLVPLEKNGQLGPLILIPYYSAVGADVEPGIRLALSHGEHYAYFDVEFRGGAYEIYVHSQWLEKLPELVPCLAAQDFADTHGRATKIISPEDIAADLVKLAQHLAEAFPSS